MSDKIQDQLTHLQKREAKLTRENAVQAKQIKRLEERVTLLTEAIRRGLPHMNLSEFLPVEEPIDE